MASRWYIIQAYSNFEKKVRDAILSEATRKGLEEFIDQIEVPSESVVEVRKGRKIESERKFFPGYVLAKMDLTDEVYHLIKNTPKVTGFLGSGTKPMPVPNAEVDRILGKVQDGVDAPRPMISFDIGEKVKVIDGSFQSFEGNVESVDEENARLEVLINIFGRATPVELDYTQVEKTS
jgi:transcriptional antiterminator NusG